MVANAKIGKVAAIGGGAGGAALGAGIGTAILPGVGTAIGAVVGALVVGTASAKIVEHVFIQKI